MPNTLLDLYARYEGDQPPESELMNALKSLLEANGRVYLIIDALDECPPINGERAKLVTMLDTLKNFGIPQLSILVTSRMESDLNGLAHMSTFPPVNIQTSELEGDIRLHVRNQLSNDSKLRGWPPDLRDEIEVELVAGACGMYDSGPKFSDDRTNSEVRFRWVSCQLESLRKCLRPSNVRQTLKTLPATLDDTYERILLNTSEEYYQEALAALTWLLFSERPLWLDEVAEIMVINLSANPAFDPNERLFDPESALTVLSSLITVTAKEARKEIHLAHYSVKEYLTSPRAFHSRASRFGIDPYAANQRILESCLVYIDCSKSFILEVLQQGREASAPLSRLRRVFPLIEYACKYWSVHASNAMTAKAKQLVVQFLNSKENLKTWTIFFDPENHGLSSSEGLSPLTYREGNWPDLDDLDSPPFDPINWEMGLENALPRLIKRHIDYSTTSSPPIYLATCLGLRDVVKDLLDTGANVNEPGGRYGSALQAASLKSHSEIVMSLLQKGANVNLRGGRFGNALQAACFGGNMEIVRHLIKAGAEIDLEGRFGSTLEAVERSSNPNPQIIMELLRHGAINRGTKRRHEMMPRSGSESLNNTVGWLLRWALIRGHEKVVKGILSKVTDPVLEKVWTWRPTGRDAEKERFVNSYWANSSPLYEAIIHRRDKTAALLLERPVRIDERDNEGRTALYWACFWRSMPIVRKILQKGADIHVTGPYGWTARYWAITCNDQSLLDTLNLVCKPERCRRCGGVEAEAKAEITRLEKIRGVAPHHSVLYDQSHEFSASVTEELDQSSSQRSTSPMQE